MSYAYSAKSQERLLSCHPDLQKIFLRVIDYVDCSIFCGHRGMEEQNYAYVNNKSKVQWPNSKHNSEPSMAVDAGPYFKEIGNTDWNDMVAFGQFAGRVIQIAEQLYEQGEITHSLRWGGDWDKDGRSADHAFLDGPHFELVEADT